MEDLKNTPIDYLPKTSFQTIKKFKSLGINNFYDLLNYFPFRYENLSLKSKINQLQPGEIATIKGKIVEIKNQRIRSKLIIQKAIIEDDTGKISLNWYNQPFLVKVFKDYQVISVAGEVKSFGRQLYMEPIEYDLDDNQIHTGRLVPVYPEKKGLSSKVIREKVFWLLNQNFNIKEFLPNEIIKYNHLIPIREAYINIHFPENNALIQQAQKRLAFNELFIIQLAAQLTKKSWQKEKVSCQFKSDQTIKDKLNLFIKNLPFKLTDAQKKVWQEIYNDLSQKKPMNRLLQGDVGSGKTVIAALASYYAHLNNFQTLLMAPTEILANQHLQTFLKLFKNTNIRIGIQTSSKKIIPVNQKDKKTFVDNFDLLIGTHALINKKLIFERVGLVIIDEQHRFGVHQRAEIKKKGINPHLLTITATPIPRTVALTLYNELDLSIINQMPSGRLPIKTYLIPMEKRQDCYSWIKKEIKINHSQVFIVCPLIEESTVESLKTIKAAKKEFLNLQNIFKDFSLGLLHGRLKPKEKDKVMNDFKQQKIQILVTTPVVEVGVDIPNASIMLIEGAERFGLAQLHQLRGRVGRSNRQSYCFLFTEKNTPSIKNRLYFFSKTNNGLKLAEKDMLIRGPGNIYGSEQHGYLNLKMANLTDYQLIKDVQSAVLYFFNHYTINDFLLLKKEIDFYRLSQIINN